AAEAGFLHAAKGGDFGGDEAAVDAHDAVFKRFGNAPDAGDVAAVEIGGETEFGIVGEGDGFRFGFEAEERSDRAESFFASDGHLRSDIGKHGRLEKAAAENVAMAADEDFCALGLCVADVVFDFLYGGIVNERSLGGSGLEAGSRLQSFDGDGKLGGENIVDRVLHEQAIRAHASLAGI